jgi:membrane-bound serine protease (ClpP class)
MDPLFWALILVAAGVGVILLELFVPSAGMLGVLAAILLISGIVLAFVSDFKHGAAVLLGTVVIIPAVLALMIKVWPSTPIGRLILLKNLKSEDVLPNSSHYTRTKDYLGRIGIAHTKMLPSGIVIIDDLKIDAVSDGFAIEAGDTVKVVSVKGNRVYVQPYDGDVDSNELPPRDRDILSQPIEELGLDSFDEPLG